MPYNMVILRYSENFMVLKCCVIRREMIYFIEQATLIRFGGNVVFSVGFA